MKTRLLAFAMLVLAAGVLVLAGVLCAQQEETRVASAKDPAPSAPAAPAATSRTPSARPSPAKQEDEDALRLEGEKRFRANCGRCHQAPHKLSPRMMATAVRHMRVRATITDEDMRVILHYMTQ
jgi:mono/diheme cytochrome c family protein